MTQLSDFPITGKWPALHPERLQLYSLPTPNGIKVSILLEELGLPFVRSVAAQMSAHDDRADFLVGIDLILQGMLVDAGH